MLKAHLTSGETLRFDLASADDAQRWMELAKTAAFQSQITGLTLCHNGVSFSLRKPTGFDEVFLWAEHIARSQTTRDKGGERLLCYAGDVSITIKAHADQRAARVDLARRGKLKFNPLRG